MIAVGALIGAPVRYLVSRAVQSWQSTAFPWGTLTINIAASFVLGALSGADPALSAAAMGLFGVGFCGSLSTYSTFSYETMRLGQDGAHRQALANVLLSVALGVGVAALGWWLARALG